MKKTGSLVFKPKMKKIWIFFTFGCISFLACVILALSFDSPKTSILIKAFNIILICFFTFYSAYWFTFPFFVYLEMSEWGIVYSNPIIKISSEWKDLNGLRIVYGDLYLSYNQNSDGRGHLLRELFFGRDMIHLSLFVDRYNTQVAWQTEKVLKELERHLQDVSIKEI